MGLLAEIGPVRRPPDLEALPEVIGYGQPLGRYRDIDQVGVHDLVGLQGGPCSLLKRRGLFGLLGYDRFGRVLAPARTRPEHDVAVEQVVGQQDGRQDDFH